LAEKPENQDKKPPPEGQREAGSNSKNAHRRPSKGAGEDPRKSDFTENGEKLCKMFGGNQDKGANVDTP
jgi:hypothetical protein